MKLKLKSETKLKDAPVEYRVALRLVTLAEQRQNQASVAQLVKDVGATVPEVMKAVDLLSKDKHIEVSNFDPAKMTIEYQVEAKTRIALVKDASSYNRHLLAKEERAQRPRKELPPPIDPAVRESWMAAARPLAVALLEAELEHATWQVAGCIARIGQGKVETLVAGALSKQPPKETGALKTFFDLYVAKRDEQV